MADRVAERKENELQNSTFLNDEAVQSDSEFDLDADFLKEEQTDQEANREHQDGEGADDDALAQTTDSDIAALAKGDNEVGADGKVLAKPEDTTDPTGEEAKPAAPTPAADPNATPGEAKTVETEQKPAAAPPAPAPAPGESETPGEAKVPSEQDIQNTYQQWRGQAEDLLATQYYALQPEVQAELELEPAKVIPRLMAKVYLDAMTASIGQMTMHFPRLVRLVNEQMAKEDESEGEFFKKWPLLKGKENEIRRFGQAWRQLNPAAPAEQFVNEVGAGVMIALRLDPTQREVSTQIPDGNTPAFVPGIGAPPRGQGRSPNGDNPFTQLNQEFEEDVDDEFS
jgi:hypothetical protein